MQAGLDRDDAEAVRNAAHSLKTQFNYMGVSEDISHIQEMERMAIHSDQLPKLKEMFAQLTRVADQAFEEMKQYLV